MEGFDLLGQHLPLLVEIWGTTVIVKLDQKRSTSEIVAKNLYWLYVWLSGGMAAFCCACVSRMIFQLGKGGRRDDCKCARLGNHDNQGACCRFGFFFLSVPKSKSVLILEEGFV